MTHAGCNWRRRSMLIQRFRFKSVMLVLLAGLCHVLSVKGQQTGITGIYTDFNGFWTSSSASISAIKPDNSHNLIGFTWNNQRYSTGVNDGLLTANGVSFSPMNFQAFPIRNINLAGTSALPALGQLKDGVDNGASTPPPFSLPANVSQFLTDGVNGLDIGTGIANIPTGTLIFDFGSIIDINEIGDGRPDILVSQIADPSSVLDSVYFTDGSGNVVGNKIAINHTAASIPAVGRWVADFYNANGTLSNGFTKTERTIRIWAADISAFGISSSNYHSALTFRYKLNGSSDPAFIAFNNDIIRVTTANNDVANTAVNTPVDIPVLNNDQPSAALNKTSVQITSAPVHGVAGVNPVSGEVTYTPASGFSGIDQFIYQVCNNNSSPQCDDATVTVNVGNANLEVSQSVSSYMPPLQSQVEFSIKVRNLGQNNGYAVRVDQLLGSGFSYLSASTGSGSYNPVTGVWTIGGLNNGQEVALTITAQVNSSGSYTSRAIVSSPLYDPDHSNDSSLVVLTPVPASSDLQIIKTVDNITARADSLVIFSIAVQNAGPSYSSGVSVTDILPSGYGFINTTVPAGTSYNSATGVWNIGNLAAGGGRTLQVQAVVRSSGNYENIAFVTGPNADPVTGNNSDTVVLTPSVGVPVFQGGNSSTRCQTGDTIRYTAEATHQSSISYSVSPSAAGTIATHSGILVWNEDYAGTTIITASAAGLNGPTVAQHVVTVLPKATVPFFNRGDSSIRCMGADTLPYTAVSHHADGLVYRLQPAAAGIIDSSSGMVQWNAGFSGTAYISAIARGCNGTVTGTHVVLTRALPESGFNYSQTSFCNHGLAVPVITGINGGSFYAAAGIFINSNSGAINLTESSVGSHTIYYTVSDGYCSTTETAVISITPNPILHITNPAAVCSPATVDITEAAVTAGSSDNLVFTYYTDSLASGNLALPTRVSNGTYFIKGADNSGCYTISPVVVTIQEKNATSISYDRDVYCSKGAVAVNRNGIAGGSFSSQPGLLVNPQTGELNLAGSTPGSYIVSYQYDNGVCADTAQAPLTITNPQLQVNPPEAVCAPGSIDITDGGITRGSSEGLTFAYFADSAGTQPLQTPNSISLPGTYYVRGTNAEGCTTVTRSVDLAILPRPKLTVTGAEHRICKGQAVSLQATTTAGTIQWQDHAKSISTIVVTPQKNTTYYVNATDDNGCVGNTNVTVQVSNFKASLSSSAASVLAGNSITLQSHANEPYQVVAWLPEAYFPDPGKLLQTITVSDSSKTFRVVAASSEGCLDTADLRILLQDNERDIFIPNAFTPNNDGRNDIFKVFGSSVKSADIKIYSQWGSLLFETGNNSTGWNGNSKNQPQPVGVYMYVIKIYLYNNDSIIRKGTVNLLR